MKATLWKSPKYKKFTQERNKVLEQVNINTQTDVSRILYEALSHITGHISHMAIQGEINVESLKRLEKELEAYIGNQFSMYGHLITTRMKASRKNVFVLTYLGELEAVARATQKTKRLSRHDFKRKIQSQVNQNTINDQPLENRVWFALEKLKWKIIHSFITTSVSIADNPKEVVDAVKKAYPKLTGYKNPPRALKKIAEADKPKVKDDQEFDFYSDLTNDSDWELAVQAYKDTELPPSRMDVEASQYDPEAGYFRYNWELEQDMTDDFVQQVRDGQVDAASDLGVKDFVWVSIIDNKTCDECCLPRNGKTTSEIEKMLSTGELDKDECDATVPPAHPHCRCDIAPVGDTDEVTGPDWKSFGDWLNS